MEIIVAIITWIVSTLITWFFLLKAQKYNNIRTFKEEKYANLLILLQGFLGNTNSIEKQRLFLEEHYKSWLYSSDDVVRSINNLILLASQESPDPEKWRKLIGNIVLKMRKDLLGKTNLGHNDFKYMDVN